jgi:hypothetical protein
MHICLILVSPDFPPFPLLPFLPSMKHSLATRKKGTSSRVEPSYLAARTIRNTFPLSNALMDFLFMREMKQKNFAFSLVRVFCLILNKSMQCGVRTSSRV